MQEASYYFDPCSLDDDEYEDELKAKKAVDEECEAISIDSWKPSEKKSQFRQESKWRKEENKKRPKDAVDLDDLKKIKAYLSRDVEHKRIMKIFNITNKVLTAIAKNKYSVTDGIILDDVDKLHLKIKKLEKQIESNAIENQHIINALMQDKKLKEAIEKIKFDYETKLKNKEAAQKERQLKYAENRKYKDKIKKQGGKNEVQANAQGF